ncbi:MAG: hypothetical protein ACE5JA_05940 [bacterium]
MALRELDFSEEKLNQWWKEVKDDFWGDLKRQTQQLVKQLLEGTLEADMVRYAGAGSAVTPGQKGDNTLDQRTSLTS